VEQGRDTEAPAATVSANSSAEETREPLGPHSEDSEPHSEEPTAAASLGCPAGRDKGIRQVRL
jgi:hypothetical protein